MKKNMEQLTLWMKTHKKKVAACMAVILLALGALGIGLAGMQKENQKTVIAKADQEKKVDEKQTKKRHQKMILRKSRRQKTLRRKQQR